MDNGSPAIALIIFGINVLILLIYYLTI